MVPNGAAPGAAVAQETARANLQARPPSRQQASPPSRSSAASLIATGTLSRAERGRVVLGVWLRDVLGALDDQHGLGQDASIGWWPMSGVGEAAVSRQALADGLLGRAPAQHALAAGVVG